MTTFCFRARTVASPSIFVKPLTFFSIAGIFLLSLVSGAASQVSISTLNTSYTQNFNGIGTGDLNLSDDITGALLGFHALRDVGNANPNLFAADDGTIASEGFKNFGPPLQLDRSLGMLPGASTGTVRFGLRFVNDTGTPVNSIHVSYTGEQWYNSGSQTPQSIVFTYRKDTSVNDLTTGLYIPVPALAFVSPNTGTVAGALDGNAAGNRTVRSATFAVTVLPGEEIMLRWEMADDPGPDHGLSVDDLVVSAQGAATAAPATISGRVTNAAGRGISGARITLSGGTLTAPRTAATGTFGYYQFDEVASGQIYVLHIEGKRNRFTNPSIFVNLLDNLTGQDFVTVD